MEVLQQADISHLNSLALPCKARVLINLSSTEDLVEACGLYDFQVEDILILGGGSNLILPVYLDKTVLRFLGHAIDYQTTNSGDVLVKVGAGVIWDDLVNELADKGLRGLENLSLIPGTVGAAPVQNIGAYGVELADVLDSVEVFNVEQRRLEVLTKDQCQFAYRDSLFKQNPGKYFILNVRLIVSTEKDFTLGYGELQFLKNQQNLDVKEIREKVIVLRQTKLPDPKYLPNVGSFFKNPIVRSEQAEKLKKQFPEIVAYPQTNAQVKLAAGWLIDQAGWKGKRIGSVGMHAQQALVLVNYADATEKEVLSFAAKVQDSILKKFQVLLEIEPVSCSL